jgi:hypothetical protein
MVSSLLDFPNSSAIPVAGKEMVRKATVTWPKETNRKKAAKIFIERIQSQILS